MKTCDGCVHDCSANVCTYCEDGSRYEANTISVSLSPTVTIRRVIVKGKEREVQSSLFPTVTRSSK